MEVTCVAYISLIQVLMLCYIERRQWHPLQYSCLGNPMDGGAW